MYKVNGGFVLFWCHIFWPNSVQRGCHTKLSIISKNGLSKFAQNVTVVYINLLSPLSIHIIVWENFPYREAHLNGINILFAISVIAVSLKYAKVTLLVQRSGNLLSEAFYKGPLWIGFYFSPNIKSNLLQSNGLIFRVDCKSVTPKRNYPIMHYFEGGV